MKSMVLAVEKRINENMTLRMKYPDSPDKFMESELELFSNLKRLRALATVPELYPTFVKTKCVPSLLSLLSHENSDISIEVVDLLHELTDATGAETEDLTVLVCRAIAAEAPAAPSMCNQPCACAICFNLRIPIFQDKSSSEDVNASSLTRPSCGPGGCIS
eukprot:scaffold207042_cov32-Tisochrysis_lutea.AAC.1